MNMEQTINTWVVAALRFAQTDECRRLSGPAAVQRFAALMKADWVPDGDQIPSSGLFGDTNRSVSMTKLGVFTEESGGARVATIREGENGVEIQDKRNGTYNLTVFWTNPETDRCDDLTAFGLTIPDLIAFRRAIDDALLDAQTTRTTGA